MVPITSNEILFLGGFREDRFSGEVSVLNLVDLKQKIVANIPDYRFGSFDNCFNVSKTGEISAAVRNVGEEFDVISFSRKSNELKVLKKGI